MEHALTPSARSSSDLYNLFLLVIALLPEEIAFLAHGLSPHLDAMGIVHQSIEHAVGDGGIADLLVPARDRQLGTVLNRVWTLNPAAYRRLYPLGTKVGLLFVLLSAALLTLGIGWFRHRRWGWTLAVAIIAIHLCPASVGNGESVRPLR